MLRSLLAAAAAMVLAVPAFAPRKILIPAAAAVICVVVTVPTVSDVRSNANAPLTVTKFDTASATLPENCVTSAGESNFTCTGVPWTSIVLSIVVPIRLTRAARFPVSVKPLMPTSAAVDRVARALGIPAVVGAGERVLTLENGDELILDGERGQVIPRPSKERRDRAGKLPGDEWQQFANARLLYAWMWAHPGKKLLFMGSEFAQNDEWREGTSLDWHLTQYDEHSGIQRLVKKLNAIYITNKELWELDTKNSGFKWLSNNDSSGNILAYARLDTSGKAIISITNFSPMPQLEYHLPLDSISDNE